MKEDIKVYIRGEVICNVSKRVADRLVKSFPYWNYVSEEAIEKEDEKSER